MLQFGNSHSRWVVQCSHGVMCAAAAWLSLSCMLWAGCEAPAVSPTTSGGNAEGASAPAATMAQAPSPPPTAPVVDEPVVAVEEPAAPPPAAETAQGTEAPSDNQIADAQPLMESNGCMRCHRIDANEEPGGFGGAPPDGGFGGSGPGGPPPGEPGPGGPGPGGPGPGGGFGGPPRGPNLAHVGANPDHTVEWIAEHIRNPKAHNPRSRMPAYAEKMSDEDIQQVAAYLATLK